MRKKIPAYGETRIRSGFLWLPVRTPNEKRWLENATWEEEYRYKYSAWTPVRFIDDDCSAK